QNCACDLAPVESTRSVTGNEPKSFREIMILEDFADRGSLAIRKKNPAAFSILCEHFWRVVPKSVDQFGYRISFLRVENCRPEKVFPRQSSKPLVQLAPTGNRARDRDSVNAGVGHRSRAFGFQVLGREALRRPSAGVQSIKLAGLGFPENSKQIATDAVHHRRSEERRVGKVSRSRDMRCREIYAGVRGCE